MAKCKRCKTNIPDGAEYCKDCLDKEKAKSNEAYLDSLLSSVKNEAPTTESIYKKKNGDLNSADSSDSSDDSIVTSDDLFDSASEDEDFYKFDIGDIEDFDQFDLEDDLSEWDTDLDKDDLYNSDAAASQISENEKEDMAQNPSASNTPKENTQEDTAGGLDDEDYYDSALNELLNNLDTMSDNSSAKPDMDTSPENNQSDSNQSDRNQSDRNQSDSNQSDRNQSDRNQSDKNQSDKNQSGRNQSDSNQSDKNQSDKNQSDRNQSGRNQSDSNQTDGNQTNSSDQVNGDQISTEQSMDEDEEEDFLSLLNQISADDPVAEDVKAINDLMNGAGVEEGNASNIPSDVGEVFSDALKAVSSLNDPNINEAELLNRVPDGTGSKKKKKKVKKEKKKKGEGQNSPDLSEKTKKSLLKRLFGNVDNGKGATYEGKSETGVKTADQKASKKKKAGKSAGKAAKDEDSPVNEGKEKQNKKVAKKNKKNEKKQSKLKTAEVIQVIDEIDEDLGRINRLGASIVFLFFGLLALLLYVGTNAITYTLSIQHASSYFSIKEYTKAYNEVYGMEIKPEDFQLYEKIQTVMFVNKQLNSYNNYYSIGEYPEALDSLLKGLERYDKYIKLADLLDITTDMDYVREQLLAELKKVFGISEKEALKINDIGNMKDYSLKVYEIAQQLKSEIKSLSKGT